MNMPAFWLQRWSVRSPYRLKFSEKKFHERKYVSASAFPGAVASARTPTILFDGDRQKTPNSKPRSTRFDHAIRPNILGLKKGIVNYTHVANHVPLNARVIGANEHESHHVFDLLRNNTTDIQPSIHSTDTHGTNEVNFAILAFFGYQFAPRYKDIRGKMGTLYGFEHPSQYRQGVFDFSRF